jgi:Flp pilus assembly protein TadG
MKRERGTVAVELAVVAPVLMLLVLGVLQFGLWYHVQNVVQTAAQEGARTAAAEDGTAEMGQARALEVLQEGLGDAARSEDAVASIDQDAAHVAVIAEMPGLLPIPGLHTFTLSSESTAYRERFRSATEGS